VSIEFQQTILSLFLFFIGIGIGAGLYEARVVHPNWAPNPSPATLGSKLISSGQAGAARRFWPFVSPVALLLALGNVYLAWHQTGQLRHLWLTSSLSIIVKSVATYAYFVPMMMRRIEHSQGMDGSALHRLICVWTTLSPLRIVAEAIAWITGVFALTLISR
jgi:hypothetical protein